MAVKCAFLLLVCCAVAYGGSIGDTGCGCTGGGGGGTTQSPGGGGTTQSPGGGGTTQSPGGGGTTQSPGGGGTTQSPGGGGTTQSPGGGGTTIPSGGCCPCTGTTASPGGGGGGVTTQAPPATTTLSGPCRFCNDGSTVGSAICVLRQLFADALGDLGKDQAHCARCGQNALLNNLLCGLIG